APEPPSLERLGHRTDPGDAVAGLRLDEVNRDGPPRRRGRLARRALDPRIQARSLLRSASGGGEVCRELADALDDGRREREAEAPLPAAEAAREREHLRVQGVDRLRDADLLAEV